MGEVGNPGRFAPRALTVALCRPALAPRLRSARESTTVLPRADDGHKRTEPRERLVLHSRPMNKILSGILSVAIPYAAERLLRFLSKRSQSPGLVAIETAVQIGRQLVIGGAESYAKPADLIRDLKAVMAIQLAKAHIYESDTAPFEPFVRRAIAGLVTEWYERTGSRAPAPIVDKLLLRR